MVTCARVTHQERNVATVSRGRVGVGQFVTEPAEFRGADRPLAHFAPRHPQSPQGRSGWYRRDLQRRPLYGSHQVGLVGCHSQHLARRVRAVWPAAGYLDRVAFNLSHIPRLRSSFNEEIFDSLADARRKLALWRCDENNVRPHSSLGNQTPAEARRALEQSEGSAPGALAQPGQTTCWTIAGSGRTEGLTSRCSRPVAKQPV
jgi:Integrase core domain